MAINGIETVLYGVNDLAECTRYFVDFGLPLLEQGADFTHFRLDEGSNVILRHISSPLLPKTAMSGTGVIEAIWGVDRQDSLDRLVRELRRDREVTIDADGTAHSHDDMGLPFGLRVYRKNQLVSSPDPVNSPGNINRLNVNRKWKLKARPKTIQHLVYRVPDFEKANEFYIQRLGFRVSDIHRGMGRYLRCPAANDHHNLFFINGKLPFEGFDGQLGFHHVNFGVEDLDEIMIGSNYMCRKGWPKSDWGLGRHRIASSLFMYLPCPTGGEAEYGADSDFVDDSWVPRVWDAGFGGFTFVHNLATPFLMETAAWDVSFPEGITPPKRPPGGHGGGGH